MTSNPRRRNPEKYAALSRHFIAKADESLQTGDFLQASEKSWGAVAQAIKSVSEERGWRHNDHKLIHDNAFRISEEWERPELWVLFSAVGGCMSISTKTT